jgi:hypothetical protein
LNARWQRGDSEPWDRAAHFFAEEVDRKDHHALTFVIIVRDPAERYVSAFNHMCIRKARGGPYCTSLLASVKKSVDDPDCQVVAKAQNISSCESMMLKYGIYWVSLTSWVNRFPDSRFIVTTMSQYERDKRSVLVEIAGALGTDATVYPSRRLNVANNRSKAESAGEVSDATALLNEYYRWHTHFYWKVLHLYTTSNKFRVTFVGTLGEF